MVNLFASFKHRVAVTTDLWTTGYQKRGYMAVTAHYIDDSWNLKSFLIRFAYVACPHTVEVICEALYECLVEWHLERKISTITLDNYTSNEIAMTILPDKLDTSSLMLDGQFLHMRCAAHILNLIVKDGMSVLEEGVERVRDSVAFWSAMPKRHEKFEKMAKH
uniref:AC transposase n=1 Tax=Triticum urartu TaxID=4572 RepID=A0A8R7UB65_TRIUA